VGEAAAGTIRIARVVGGVACTAEAIDWIWDRYMEFSDHGRFYSEK